MYLFDTDILSAVAKRRRPEGLVEKPARTPRAALEHTGKPRFEPDLQIAAAALRHDLTLVTGNVRHFSGIPGLRVENWLE